MASSDNNQQETYYLRTHRIFESVVVSGIQRLHPSLGLCNFGRNQLHFRPLPRPLRIDLRSEQEFSSLTDLIPLFGTDFPQTIGHQHCWSEAGKEWPQNHIRSASFLVPADISSSSRPTAALFLLLSLLRISNRTAANKAGISRRQSLPDVLLPAGRI